MPGPVAALALAGPHGQPRLLRDDAQGFVVVLVPLAAGILHRQYRPQGDIDVLFIAEAPPADPARFFYFDHVEGHDWLYLALMRCLFDDARETEASQLREDKPDYLARFQADGYYLLDASAAPIPQGTSQTGKRRTLRNSLDQLLARVHEVAGADTRVVLISRSVFDVCAQPLRDAGFRVVNSEMIDFPASGRQTHFTRKLHAALHASDAHLQDMIRGIEASIEYFGAGRAKQRERELYVVEHFLRAIGQRFSDGQIEQPQDDPPDARFRGAAFEVKEIQRVGRRRSDEFRQQLARAKAAISCKALLDPFTPQGMPIADAWRRIMDQAREIAGSKYPTAAVRSSLDLLFYLNLGMREAWDVEDGPRPDLAPLVADGWRSVSFLHGERTACVLYASSAAPEFLRAAVGRLFSPGE